MSIGDDYLQALRDGNYPLANFLAKGLASNAGININTNQVSADPNAVSTTSNGWFSGLPALPALPSLSDILGNSTVLPGLSMNDAAGAVSSAADATSSAAKAAKGAWNLFTDPYRFGSIFIGGLLIAAGLFGLAGGKAEHVIQMVQKTAP